MLEVLGLGSRRLRMGITIISVGVRPGRTRVRFTVTGGRTTQHEQGSDKMDWSTVYLPLQTLCGTIIILILLLCLLCLCSYDAMFTTLMYLHLGVN